MAALRDATITLPDGRRLAYTEWGVRGGTPVLYFHGTPASRLWCPDEDATAVANVRLIIPDRPGIGRSDALEARGYGDWPADVEGLADALGITTFGTIGVSAGGPYAAACAALIPKRLTGVALVSSRGLASYNWGERPEVIDQWDSGDRACFELAKTDPRAAAALVVKVFAAEFVSNIEKNPESFHEALKAAPGDRWFFEDPTRRAIFDAYTREAWRQGLDNLAWDLNDGFMPWGFRLADITLPVHLFHGSQDPWVTQEHMDFAARTIPNSTLVVWNDAGHLGFVKHWDEVLAAVT